MRLFTGATDDFEVMNMSKIGIVTLAICYCLEVFDGSCGKGVEQVRMQLTCMPFI